jgi:uncharacterized protein YeaC (DUF1315 family)
VGEEQVKDRIFNATAKMLPTEQEISMLNNQMTNAIASTPDLAMYLDTFKVIQIAKEDVKLAERYYHSCMKKMIESKIKQNQDNQMMTIQGQQQSAMVAEQEKRKSLVLELKTKALISDKETNNALKVATVTQILMLRAKGVELPPQWASVESEIIKNVELPLFAENMASIDALITQQIEGTDGEQDQGDSQPPQPNQQPQPQAA